MKKSIIILLVVTGFIIGILLLFAFNSLPSDLAASGNNVISGNGRQIIEITVKGGYSPKISEAKAGIPTILRFKTNGTFDCSSVVSIPELNVIKYLPISGTTDIDLGSRAPGHLAGSCGMGMFSFGINFR